ncbi:MAG: lipoprotein [Pseudomonadota bacterium]
MKTYLLPPLIGLYFISLGITGCGQRGDLVRPVPTPVQAQEKPEKKQ